MLPKIKHILYATDLSENARYAFGYAASMAEKYEAGITILHVIEDLSPSFNMHVVDLLGETRWQSILMQNMESLKDNIRGRLDDFCTRMEEAFSSCRFVVTDTEIRQGRAVDEILAMAEDDRYDIVVMGTHGYGVIAGALMGSTARRVIRRCVKPVMVIRLPQ